ncbi:galanin receptor type 1-like [Cyanistes caeruleus]|uniref:Galanin receptor type 1 n=13 Tax=Passeriformes TaxID=9126 RepID=A0A8C0V330_CYACU|nr:galanin receptor type 1-like [Cyanistes caeruleus]XP_023790517.1 galanin receptor type 1-like [Cyanistes caeruleus]
MTQIPQLLCLPVPGIICTRDRENLEESSEENYSSKERHSIGKEKSSPLATPNKHRRTCQSQGCSDCSLPGSMEEQENNFVLSLGANSSSRCSLEPNQTEAPMCWAGATRGGPEVVIVPVLFGLIFLLGMVGNTLVLVVLGRLRPGGRPSRSATNIFILNLSIADFSFLLFCVPFQATIYSLPEWIFGAFFCKWVHYLAMATMLVSIFTLVAMSVDRYIAVVHAKRSPCIRSKRNAALGVAVIWLLSLLIAIPVAQHQALMSGHQQAPNSSFCWEHWANGSTAKQMYKITILLVGYLLPLLLITCCYAKVLYHLHTKVKNISKKSERSKKKTAQTVLLVVAVFLLSWLPHHIITMWAEFGHFPLNNISFTFRIISHCLAYGNSCINPILYAFLSENFRKACRQVFTCKLFLRPVSAEKLARVRMENFSTTHSTTNV